jgi:hypothetical protein
LTVVLVTRLVHGVLTLSVWCGSKLLSPEAL